MPLNSYKYHQSKQVLPTDLRTREMSFLSQQVRERAFWSAGIEDARILSDVHSVIGDIVNGNLSNTEGRVKINSIIKRYNYKPTTGTEGGIKDLNSFSRQNITLKTNIEMARGYAQLEEAQDDLYDFPCYELVRSRRARQPRDWVSGNNRWLDNGGKLYNGRMIAPVNSSIWRKISRFGNPYPPFDFNSGMTLVSIDRDESIELGVVGKDDEPMQRQQIPSINENLEAKLNAPAKLLQQVENRFAGFATRDGDRIIFTDPNGTKPYSAKDIVSIINPKKLPNIYNKDESPYLQRDAFVQWVEDSNKQRYNPDLDITADVGRLFERIEPMANNAPLFRGLSFDTKDNKHYKQLLENLNNGFFQTDAFNSTSTDRSAAEGFAMKKSFQVLVEFKKHNTAKDLKYLVDAFSDGYGAESEVMLLKKKKYKVIKKEQTVASNGLPLLKIDVEVMND